MHLLDLIFPLRSDEAVLRGVEPREFLALLSPALVPATRPATAALLPFRDATVRAVLHEAKYHGTRRAFALLAATLADFLPEHLADLGAKRAAIIPVPLGNARLNERGYNQVEEVARRALQLIGDPAVTLAPALLARVRETPTQVSLARAAREQNMRGAFGASLPSQRADIYIVLDDVLTTGATLGAAIDALAAVGLPRERLLPIALAH